MKKRVLALMMSAVMLLSETLPVMATEDTVVVSEDEAVIEEVADAEADEEIEDVVFDSEIVVEDLPAAVDETADAELAAEAATELIDGLEVVDKQVEINEEAGLEIVTLTAKISPDAATVADAGTYWQLGGESTLNIAGGAFMANGKSYDLNTNVMYYSIVNYRARNIKPVDDLKAEVVKSGIYDLAKDLTVTGAFNPEVIKWKFSAKKAKNAGAAAASFTVKASVDKNIAKSLGITGKSLKTLKKAAKQLSKVAKKTKALFTINPANLQALNAFGDVYISITMYYNLFTRAFVKWGKFAFRVRLEENAPTDKTKWKKLPAKDFKKKIVKAGNGCNITITPKNKNLVGDAYTYELR